MRGNPHGYLTAKSYKPANQNFEGEAAGGSGTFGLINTGKDHRQAPSPSGAFGPSVSAGDASGEAKRLIAKSTAMNVEGSS